MNGHSEDVHYPERRKEHSEDIHYPERRQVVPHLGDKMVCNGALPLGKYLKQPITVNDIMVNQHPNGTSYLSISEDGSMFYPMSILKKNGE